MKGRTHVAMAAGREFDAVRRMLDAWGALAAGVGDDCAVLDLPPGERLCVSTDSSVEGVHFRRDWLAPAEIGYRAAAAALSDLAAMGARPVGLLLAITVPRRWRDDLPALAAGVGDAAAGAGAQVVGGDTTAGELLSLTVTVLGAAARPVPRGGARPGDAVYVTGTLGGPGAALRALAAGAVPAAAHRARFARPTARVREGAWLAERGATALVDLSDGLLADAGHVAAASGVRVVIDAERVPHLDGIAVRDAASSGEEYELLCSIGGGADGAEFASRFGIPLTAIGRVEAGAPSVEFHVGGSRVDLPGGHDHFSDA
jgi:thiamine-monophosphate kinase